MIILKYKEFKMSGLGGLPSLPTPPGLSLLQHFLKPPEDEQKDQSKDGCNCGGSALEKPSSGSV